MDGDMAAITGLLDSIDDIDELFGQDSDIVAEELLAWVENEAVTTTSVDDGPTDENLTPVKLSKSKPGCETSRFPLPTRSPQRKMAARGVIPRNTEASTQWALRNFIAWAKNREAAGDSHAVPKDLLESHDAELVCKWLSLYVMETRREDGGRYPPTTIRNLISGLNRILQSHNVPFSVLDKSDVRFRSLMNTLDTVSSSLHKEGIGVSKESAAVISAADETLFWERNVLGFSTPKLLQVTVFFYVGLNFVLRGVQEQYDLVPSQFVRVPEDRSVYDDSVFYRYIEYISKNNQHRFKDVDSFNKEVCAYAQPDSERCVVKMLDRYLALLPSDISFFYLRPLGKFAVDPSKASYAKQRVGVGTLKKVVPEICVQSGCAGKYTNHSLRATAITRMYNSGVPEKLIAETSGHKSTKALRQYEHTSEDQKRAVTSVINNAENHDGPSCSVQKNDGVSTGNMLCTPVTASDSSGTFVFSGTLSNCTINVMK